MSGRLHMQEAPGARVRARVCVQPPSARLEGQALPSRMHVREAQDTAVCARLYVRPTQAGVQPPAQRRSCCAQACGWTRVYESASDCRSRMGTAIRTRAVPQEWTQAQPEIPVRDHTRAASTDARRSGRPVLSLRGSVTGEDAHRSRSPLLRRCSVVRSMHSRYRVQYMQSGLRSVQRRSGKNAQGGRQSRTQDRSAGHSLS